MPQGDTTRFSACHHACPFFSLSTFFFILLLEPWAFSLPARRCQIFQVPGLSFFFHLTLMPRPFGLLYFPLPMYRTGRLWSSPDARHPNAALITLFLPCWLASFFIPSPSTLSRLRLDSNLANPPPFDPQHSFHFFSADCPSLPERSLPPFTSRLHSPSPLGTGHHRKNTCIYLLNRCPYRTPPPPLRPPNFLHRRYSGLRRLRHG